MSNDRLGDVLTTEERRREYLMLVFLYVRDVPQFLDEEQKHNLFQHVHQDGSADCKRLQSIMQLHARDPHHDSCPHSWEPKFPFG
jgi:hypothetical protein